MIVCGRCKQPARLFVFGDSVNEDYESLDLCPDCAVFFRNMLIHYKHGDDLAVQHSESEV